MVTADRVSSDSIGRNHGWSGNAFRTNSWAGRRAVASTTWSAGTTSSPTATPTTRPDSTTSRVTRALVRTRPPLTSTAAATGRIITSVIPPLYAPTRNVIPDLTPSTTGANT